MDKRHLAYVVGSASPRVPPHLVPPLETKRTHDDLEPSDMRSPRLGGSLVEGLLLLWTVLP